ncbi:MULTISPECIES: LON peptidase substrate-binding domain-containing protein [unclassified Sphingomonas]|uniref:LON peptidase substrate-binding domain-containing protein n=1 Tax=unclassified Sphingomonas TaxID=196159 RepID=UPI0006F24AA6|nr:MULTISPECIES: LON peptidase substrate-binding domain-containing protein [unclassified Sphingomonas]KQX17668.1 ATP-dependent protease [Sphingomonas sp. Root1294]KQY70594.1 ATP-dependent protease [Sphingomonas sp. Root50]KRB91916.1 ATP-dependent protease [Sphingomonas sp. Root720]
MADRLSIFPLAGALLFPRSHLPLHIFEPRYRALVTDALARDRRISMIQPRDEAEPPTLFEIGCVGHIREVERLDDGRFNIVLEGITRFRVLRELAVSTPFRQIEADLRAFDDADAPDALPSIVRAEIEREARRFADSRGVAVDWTGVSRLDDETLVNAISAIAPFDAAAKQALLEAATLAERADLLAQFLGFFRRGDDEPATLQ